MGIKLQWGRDFSAAEIRPAGPARFAAPPRFNGAATFQPRKFQSSFPNSRIRVRASMGPRLFSRGNLQRAGMIKTARSASMGPRLFSRGNFLTGWCRRVMGSASMGATCAEIEYAAGAIFICSFRGRDFSAAEMAIAELKRRATVHASWGRDFQPRKYGGRTTRQARLFNGAATFQPRNDSVSRRKQACRLQWGATFQPRNLARGRRTQEGVAGRDFSAAERGSANTARSSFNGAATFRAECGLGIHPADPTLQWGRDFSAEVGGAVSSSARSHGATFHRGNGATTRAETEAESMGPRSAAFSG